MGWCGSPLHARGWSRFRIRLQCGGRQLTSVSAGGSSYNSYFTTAGLLGSRSNPFRTQTITDRDGAGRILTQVVTAGSTTPLSETNTWLADSRLDTYSAVRDGANAWNESRDYGYDARGQVLTETFAPGPETTATLDSRSAQTNLASGPRRKSTRVVRPIGMSMPRRSTHSHESPS